MLELTGPEHWRCDGGFRRHAAATTFAGDNQNLPYFVAGADTYSTVNFFVPAGSYTATIQAPIRAWSNRTRAASASRTAPPSTKT